MSRELITPNLVDFMAASVIPLFHATKTHHALLGRHLNEMEDQKLAEEYRDTCQRFFDLLTNPTEHRIRLKERWEDHKATLLQELEESEAERASFDAKHREALSEITATLEISEIMGHNPSLSDAEEQLWENHQCLSQKINFLLNQVELFTHSIDHISKIIDHPTKTDEAALFLEEVELFVINFGGGHEQLTLYLDDHPLVRDFFFEADNQVIFYKVASNFINRVAKANHSVKGRPLPAYLCPFHADDPRFCYTVDKERFRHYDKVYETAQRYHLEMLCSQLREIQALLPDPTEGKARALTNGLFTSTIESSDAADKPCRATKEAGAASEKPKRYVYNAHI